MKAQLITLLTLLAFIPSAQAGLFDAGITKQNIRGFTLNENGGFENSKSRWTGSGSSIFSTVSSGVNKHTGAKSGSWDATANGETLQNDLTVIPDGLQGKSCLMTYSYKGGDPLIEAQIWDGTQVIATVEIASAAGWLDRTLNFTCPTSGSIGFRLLATGDAEIIYLDAVLIGLFPENGIMGNPIVYDRERSIGTVGSVANAKGALVDGDVTFASSAYFPFAGDVINDASLGGNFTEVSSPNQNGLGFFNRENLYVFDGTSHLSSTDVFFNPGNGNSYTMMGWVKINWENVSSAMTPFGNLASPSDRGFYISIGTDSTITFNGTNTAAGIDTGLTVPHSFINGSWHHLTQVYDFSTTTQKAYIDGVLVATGTLANQRSVTASFFGIGSLGGSINRMNGSVQDFMFTQSVLTDLKINALYSKRFSNHHQIAGAHELTNDSFPLNDLSGKIAYWNLKDLTDGSGNSKTLTNNGTTLFDGLGIFGEGDVANFNGTTQYFSIPDGDAFFQPVDKLTMGGWIRVRSYTSSQNAIGKYESTGTGRSYVLNISATNYTLIVSSDGTNTDDVNVPHNNSKEWVHVVAVMDGLTKKIYLNGVLENEIEGTQATVFDGDEDFLIGLINTDFFDGEMQAMFYTPTVMLIEDIAKLASAKIDTGISVPIEGQDWAKSLWGREDGKINNQLIPDWLVDTNNTSIYLDTGLPSGSSINLKMVDNSFTRQVAEATTFNTGMLSTPPASTLAHGLPGLPASFYVLTEGQTTPGTWTERHDLCRADEIDLRCNLDGLLIDATHRVKIVASMAPGGILIQNDVDSIGPLSVGSVGSVANAQGALIDSDFPTPANVTAYAFNNNINKTAGTAVGTLISTGSPTFDGVGFFNRENLLSFPDGGSYLKSTPADTQFDIDPTVNSFSWGGWFQTDDWKPFFTSTLAGRGATVASYIFQIGGDGTLRSSIGGGATLSIPHSFTNEWVHFAATSDSAGGATSHKFYLNGQLVGANARGALAANDEFTLNGFRAIPIQGIKMKVQDFFFDKGTILSSSQINAIYSKRYRNNQQIAAGHILTNDSFPFSFLTGKVSYWNLSDLTDGSGNGKTLTNNGSTPFTGFDIFGQSGIAEFNGSSQSLSSTDTFLTQIDTGEFSTGGFFKFNKLPSVGGATQTLISVQNTATVADRVFSIFGLVSDEIEFVMVQDDDTFSTAIKSSSIIRAGEWIHIYVVFDGSTKKLYINGNKVASTLAVGLNRDPSGSTFRIGARRTAAELFFDGSAQSVMFSNKALSDEDIHKLYSSKITHDRGTQVREQLWRATYQREDAQFTAILENGWITSMDTGDIYVDFSDMPSGSLVTPIFQ